LAAAVAAAVSRQGVPIKSLLVDQPMLNHTGVSPTYVRHGATTIADVSWLRWAWSVYLPNGPPEEPSSLRWLVSPLLSPAGGFGGPSHPPTIVVTATADPLEDDGIKYAEALREAAPAAAVTHIRARGSHVLGLTLDRKARREMLSAWSQLLGGA
jgi:acetyl esterase